MDALSGLDDYQRTVATLEGPVCVLAGAGTGKTRALTHRIAHGVNEGKYQAENVLALTFTSKAAAEMGTRLRRLGIRGVATRTFHAAALRQLQHFWPTVTGGYLPDIAPSKAGLVAKALEGLGISVDTALVRDIAGEIEWRKVHGYTVEEYHHMRLKRVGGLPGGLSMEVLSGVHEKYEVVKDEQSRIDFEDVLLATVGLLEEEKRVLDKVRQQYSVFLVDEYQDVSPIQQRLLDVWLGDRDDLLVVGDASQTIYTFAGATSSYLLEFPTRYPQATLVTLQKNYRSTPAIIQAANSVVRGRPGALVLEPTVGEGAPLTRHIATTDEAEATFVAQRILERLAEGRTPDDIAILMRFGAQSLRCETALRARGISVRIRGATPFFDEVHVKRAVMEIRGAAVAGVGGPFLSVVEDVLFGLGLTPIEPDHQGAERARYEDLVALRELAAEQESSLSLAEFSTLLSERSATGDAPNVGAVTLTTVHSAKGREWPLVFMVGLTEGQFPISHATTEGAIEEERRLFYVGVTRAREELVLSMAERSKEGSGMRKMSRFLEALGRPNP